MTSVRPWSHRLISLCVVVALLAGIVPLPLGSSGSISKDASSPYPCQHHRCGCRSSEQCWKKCCCFTNQQKLAWAKKHNVTPPAYVVTAANREESSVTSVAQKCREKTQRSCPLGKCSHRRGNSPNDIDHTAKTESAQNVSDTDDSPVQNVIGALAQQCRGESSFWNSLPWLILPPAIEISARRVHLTNDWSLSSDENVDLSLSPPVPPPRSV